MLRRRRQALTAVLFLLILPSCRSQGKAESGGYYIIMDLFVHPKGTVAFYGETNKLPVNLDPHLGNLAPKDGSFSNTTDGLTSKNGLNWTLRLAITEDYSNVFINVYLPYGASVMDVGPRNWTIFPDKKGLLVNFHGSFRSGDEIYVRYQSGSEVPRNPWNYVLATGAAGAALVASLLGLRRFRPRPRPGPPAPPVAIDRAKMEAILPTLNERERLVLESIVKEGGRVSQRKLRHICDLPKSTLSRVTDELQRKGLVRKIPVGQTNELRVDEKLFQTT